MSALSKVILEEFALQQLSTSLLRKISRADRLFWEGAKQRNLNDPVSLCPQSPDLVAAVLWQYTGLQEALKDDNIDSSKAVDLFQGMVSAIRWCYDQCSIRFNWFRATVTDGAKFANGNPLR